MPKKAKPPTRAAGAKVATAALSGLLGAGLPLIASPQARLNEMRPTPFVPPNRTRPPAKGKEKGRAPR
jgi:hypothetical protein